MAPDYVGRFAPSPTGPLHLGSLAAAMASYLDARVNNGIWLIRMEDLDPQRSDAAHAHHILNTLTRYGLQSDGEVVYQSRRGALYQSVFEQLQAGRHLYGCHCSRKMLEDEPLAHGERLYRGRCRNAPGLNDSPIRSWRFRAADDPVVFFDRWYGVQAATPQVDFGDFSVRRGDGVFNYQLAVVADDIDQRVNAVVRGADLLLCSARQRLIYRALNQSPPSLMHIPLVVDEGGGKLSKQRLAPSLKFTVQAELRAAAAHLHLGDVHTSDTATFWPEAMRRWSLRFPRHTVRSAHDAS